MDRRALSGLCVLLCTTFALVVLASQPQRAASPRARLTSCRLYANFEPIPRCDSVLGSRLTAEALQVLDAMERLPLAKDRPDPQDDYDVHFAYGFERGDADVGVEVYGLFSTKCHILVAGAHESGSHVYRCDRMIRRRIQDLAIRASAEENAKKWAKWRAERVPLGPVVGEEVLKDVPRELRQRVARTYAKNRVQRAWAAFELGRRKEDALRTLPALIRLLSDTVPVMDSDPYDTSPGAEALAAILPLREQALAPLAAAFRSKDYPERHKLAIVLAWLADVRAVPALRGGLGDDDFKVRRDAASALGLVPDPRAVEPLIAALQDRYPSVRTCSARALGKIADPRAEDPLIAALSDTDDEVRASAARALGGMRGSRVLEPLLASLKDREPYVCASAAWALAQIKERQAVGGLIALLKRKGDETQRQEWGLAHMAAVRALGAIGDRRAVEPLISVLKGGDHTLWTRAAAATALGKLGDPRAVEPLTVVLADRRKEITRTLRIEAVRALGAIGDPAAVDAIRDALENDSNVAVQIYAQQALKRLSSRSSP